MNILCCNVYVGILKTLSKTKHFFILFTCELAWNTSQTAAQVKTDVECGHHREMRGEMQ